MSPDETGRNYDKIAEWWINEQMKNPEYGMTFIRKAINYSKENSTALDIGCGGTGRTIDELLKKGHSVIGLDVSSEMIRLAKAKHSDVQFIHSDFCIWPTDKTFDLILAWDSLFHAPMELQERAFTKMCDLLNPKGILLFTTGAYESEVSGPMKGVHFEYSSIGYRNYLKIIENKGCKLILMEEDQYPAGHMVFLCQKSVQD